MTLPRSHASTLSRQLAAAVTLALIFATLAPPLRAQFGKPGKIKDFKLPEFYELIPGEVQTNRLKSLITGAEAQPQVNGPVAVTKMRIETYQEDGRTNLIAKAPQCLVELSRRVVMSTGRLEVVTANGQLFIEGDEGFFCRLTNFNLVISNHVRTVIRQELVKTASP